MLKIIIMLSLIILTSCGGNETNKENPKNEIPEALQEESVDLKSYSKSDNLTEELYQELVANNQELKNLETEIDEFNPEEIKNKFYKYDSKSINYYQSAKNQAEVITDSLTKNKIINLIKKSNKKYVGKTAELNGLLKSIAEKENSINDYHNILKIILTIPIIEKYQNENLPAKTEFENVLRNENKLIEKTKKFTPKY
jgi:predicted transcriptional regulator